MNYQGAFNVVVDKESKLINLSKSAAGKYTADNADAALQAAVEFASKNKEYGFNRWDFYIPDVNQTLDYNDKRLPANKVIKAIKDGFVPTVVSQKWGKPKMVIASPIKSTAAKVTSKVLL